MKTLSLRQLELLLPGFHHPLLVLHLASSSSHYHHHPYPHHHQPGERTHLLVVPGVHSNRSIEEVLSHVSFQPQSISRIHSSFLSPLTKSHKQLEATSFFQYSLQGVPKETLEVGAQQKQQSSSSTFLISIIHLLLSFILLSLLMKASLHK